MDERPAKPRGSCLVAAAIVVGLALLAVLSVARGRLLWPVLAIVALPAFFGLQYLLWGWLFERIYRPKTDEAAKLPDTTITNQRS